MSEKLDRGYVQVYTGNGKGKTTAALGLALRAVGHGMKVYVIQFMKGSIDYGELAGARRLAPELEVVQMGRECFVNKKSPSAEDVELARRGLELARDVIAAGGHDVVILDEINCAVDFNLVPVEDVLELVRSRPDGMELVLTGRGASEEIIEAADLVTEMREVKHYYAAGVDGRVGIER